ncbi:ABC-three component system protein [Mesorhizobium sp.]|uniref:ABC-three component system protein n=1 Tax=Mesorhizobium sp. TaxID=1871066 RepID=UPI000FE4FEAF|nr:ABC-three component system protein [Mesorhizobium sp.]RWQ24203.1 MAG: hypothetical protein EOR93_04610 [Mesorhizobium sp.]
MDAFQTYHYKVAFALKARSSFGTAFQDFFSTVLEKTHGANFVRVRAFGSLGDKGCDGYLTSSGRVYQGFGKLQDAAVSVATLVQKIENDYKLAATHLNGIMKEWHFAHNLVDGLPTEAVLKLEAMKKDYPETVFGLVSPATLESMTLALSEPDLLQMLGPAATAEDSRNLNLAEVRAAVDALIASISQGAVQSSKIQPVPQDKLAFNKLPDHWVHLIAAGSKNAPHVREYFERHPVAETGDIVAENFSTMYRALKLENMAPGEIMDALYERVTGLGFVSAARQVAAQALLAYLFDACDIFEDHASKVPA